MRRTATVVLCGTILAATGCTTTETYLTNRINRDGSVERFVEIKTTPPSSSHQFVLPLDSLWTITRTIEQVPSGDSARVLRAVRIYPDSETINREYAEWDETNSQAIRKVSFEKRFRWFITFYRFTKTVEHKRPARQTFDELLSEEELNIVLLPISVSKELFSGVDSLKYNAMKKNILDLFEESHLSYFVEIFIDELTTLFEAEGADSALITTIKEKEEVLIAVAEEAIQNDEMDLGLLDQFDSERAAGYGHIIDTALENTEDFIEKWGHLSVPFIETGSYTLMVVMPGRVKSSNGYLMPSGEVAWQVLYNCPVTGKTTFYAESYRHNLWALIITATIVILLIVTGVSKRIRHTNLPLF